MNYISDFVPLSMGGSLLEFLPMSNPCFLQRMKTPFLCLKALFGRKRKTAGIFLFIPRILKRYFAFSGESECFSVWMQDSNNYLDINEQEFIDCCFGNMKF